MGEIICKPYIEPGVMSKVRKEFLQLVNKK